MGRSHITHITSIPAGISRDAAVARLHDHVAMIQLNPLVIRQEPTDAPPTATRDEAELGTWYSITDMINYLPGGLYKGEVSYKACFYNLSNGIQTHVFAPAGVDIKSKWSVGGNMPGEPREPSELGVDKPSEGLYIKEEIELRCNMLMGAFVKRNLQNSHREVHNKIIEKAAELEQKLVALMGLESSNAAHHRRASSEDKNLVSPAPMCSSSGLISPPADSLRSLQSRELDFSCTCRGTTHLPSCSFFHPSDLQHRDVQHISSHSAASASAFTSSRPAMANPPPASLQRTVSELSGSPATGQCLCVGGLHEEGCSFYPGLRLPSIASAPQSSDSSSQRTSTHNHVAATGEQEAPRSPVRAGHNFSRPLSMHPSGTKQQIRT